MSRDRVERLLCPGKPAGCTGIEDNPRTYGHIGRHGIDIDPGDQGCSKRQVTRQRRWAFCGEREPRRSPGWEATVKHADSLMTQPLCEPPEARCPTTAIRIVGDETRVAGEPECFESGSEVFALGQGVTSTAQSVYMVSEIVIEADVYCPGQVFLRIRQGTRLRVHEVMAAVDQKDRLALFLG